jgi:hypothetical protein
MSSLWILENIDWTQNHSFTSAGHILATGATTTPWQPPIKSLSSDSAQQQPQVKKMSGV